MRVGKRTTRRFFKIDRRGSRRGGLLAIRATHDKGFRRSQNVSSGRSPHRPTPGRLHSDLHSLDIVSDRNLVQYSHRAAAGKSCVKGADRSVWARLILAAIRPPRVQDPRTATDRPDFDFFPPPHAYMHWQRGIKVCCRRAVNGYSAICYHFSENRAKSLVLVVG